MSIGNPGSDLLTEVLDVDWRGEIRELLTGTAVSPERRCSYCATSLEPDVERCPQCGEDLAWLFERPPLHEAYYCEALLHYEAAELAQALESLDLCLRLVPDYVPALRLSAGMCALTGRLETAASHVARLLTLSPVEPANVRLAAAIGVASETRQRAPLWGRAVTDRALRRDNRLAGSWTPIGARKSPYRTALAGVVDGVSMAALVQWVISRVFRRPAGRGRPGS